MYLLLMILLTLLTLLTFELPTPLKAITLSPALFDYVLTSVGITQEPPAALPLEHETYNYLDTFFAQRNIKSYADAAHYGRDNSVFVNPDEFCNVLLWNACVTRTNADTDIHESKQYELVFYAASSIDVFIDRLAALVRLVKLKIITIDTLTALEQDLNISNYLTQLLYLFEQEFDHYNQQDYSRYKVREQLAQLLEQGKWFQTACMASARQLIKCDKAMEQLEYEKIMFTDVKVILQGAEDRDTEKLLQKLSTERFVQEFSQNRQMIDKAFPNCRKALDTLVSWSASLNKQGELSLVTPQEHAMVELYHFYRILCDRRYSSLDWWNN